MGKRRNVIYFWILASVLGGLFTGRTFLFTLAYIFSGLLLVSYIWAWTSVRWLVVSRKTRARRAQVGRNLEEAFRVRNSSFLPKLWLEVRDHSDLPGHRASHVVPALGGRRQYRWYVETPCQVRGEFRLGPLTVISGDPFGFFTAPRRIDATSRVVVYPATVPLPKFELPIGVLSGGEAQRQRSHYVTTNASGVRDYVQGDSINRIHWKSTARRDKLIVKEFEIDPLVDIWLLTDFSAQSLVEAPSVRRVGQTGVIVPTGPGIPPSTEEYSVVATASLAKYFVERERALGFVAYTPNREVHQPERGSRQLTHILETLAVARSFATYSLAQMLTLEAPYFTRGTTLIVVTASLDPIWINEAQILARRGIQTMCVLIDPYTFGGLMPSEEMRGFLRVAKIPTIVVSQGDDLGVILSQRPQ
jgi:uncharacterized protein (DUF58 family)